MISFEQIVEAVSAEHRYFNHFNRIGRIYMMDEDSYHLVLYREARNIESFQMYKDFRVIVNSMFTIFGVDNDGKASFDNDEITEIKNRSWPGRLWSRNQVSFKLLQNQVTGRINLTIGPVTQEYRIEI